MSLRFSSTGPEFPSALIDALFAGDVVFLCGTGISAPQLPDFKQLVDRLYARLGVDMSPSEHRAYAGERFEEVLGSLSRGLADPLAMLNAAADLLAVPADANLGQHRTVARLSRDLANRVLVVTTNFDTLIEQAVAELYPHLAIQPISFAGQALPAPGSPDFAGIIHIHGRLEDGGLGLSPTPLVLTSADYGDAYMRSGWASRFLFDLARCKTIVLVGYSANDAPVRYFLNVVEADRARFPDLRPIYAFDSYEAQREDAEAPWGTVAVTPLAYCRINPETGIADHSPLWRDLEKLADIVERPKRERENRARALLTQATAALTDDGLRELAWLFGGRADLWGIAIETITDPAWFTVFEQNKLWKRDDASWVIAAWIALAFDDLSRLQLAAEWQGRLGRDFTIRLEQRLHQAPALSPFLQRAWRLLLEAGGPDRDTFEDRVFTAQRNLQSGMVLDADLRRTVGLLTPKLRLRQHFRGSAGQDADGSPREPRRLGDLLWTDLSVADDYGADELVQALGALAHEAARILDLATGGLAAHQALNVDLGMIEDDYDTSDFSVPSIEDHGQNEHHNGVLFLVRAAVAAYETVATQDRRHARAAAQDWGTLPGRLGKRLALHAMRNVATFDADEALDTVLGLSLSDFWNIRREIALLLADRAGTASQDRIDAVTQRILETGELYYARYPIEEGQADWRAHARDAEVWLRLLMLEGAERLSAEAQAELAAIKTRRLYLDRAVEDSDFFSSYSSGVHTVTGTTEPLTSVEPDDRLQVAQELVNSNDIERHHGWQAYCRLDPRGAFQTLAAAELSEPNLALWNAFAASLSVGDDKEKALRHDLAVETLQRLAPLAPHALRPVAASLVDLLFFGPRRRVEALEDWCDRLWEALSPDPIEINAETDIYGIALNTPAGRLVQMLVGELDESRKAGGPNLVRQVARLRQVAAADGGAATLARAVIVHEIAFLLTADDELVRTSIVPRLDADGAEAKALRRVLITYANVTPAVSHVAANALIRGAVESAPSSQKATAIASRILRPALAAVRGEADDRWGITAGQVRTVLRQSPAAVRKGALNVLARWLHGDEAGVEATWDLMVGPFFAQVWPKERRFVDEANNQDLIALAVGAGARFPIAFATLRNFMSPFSGNRGSLHAIKKSTAPEQYARDTLDLLWTIYGPHGEPTYEMGDILDRLIIADASLEVDRRLQSLEQRTTRLR